MLRKLFGRKSSDTAGPVGPIYTLDEAGILYAVSSSQSPDSRGWERDAYLAQLGEEDYASQLTDAWLIPWDSLYELLENPDHASSVHLLALPEISKLRPQLGSEGSISDAHFRVFFRNWVDPVSQRSVHIDSTGAVIEHGGISELLPKAAWQLVQAIAQLRVNQQQSPSEAANQVGWAKIRKLGEKAGAGFDGFLNKTIVVRPESLKLRMRKSGVQSAPVIELEPSFEGEPANWLGSFDRHHFVQDRYHITSDDGSITHVLISPEVKAVLETVRALPGRRVAGDEALSFIKNPYAFLGDEAVKVLPPEEYETELADAGIYFHRFSFEPILTEDGLRISHVDLWLDPLTPHPAERVNFIFNAPHEFSPFVKELGVKLAAEMPACFWRGYEIEMGDFDLAQLQGIEALLERWQKEAIGVEFDAVLDLGQYGARVVGIGVAEKLSSPYLQRESTASWLPAETLGLLGLDGDLLARWDTSSQADFEEFGARIEQAQAANAVKVNLPVLELALDLPVARQLYETWSNKFKSGIGSGSGSDNAERTVLLTENNIDDTKYVVPRDQILDAKQTDAPELPLILRSGVELREHQRIGVTWLQSLFKLSPTHVSGCVLADDMGLGKTLQLLTFIARHFETNATSEPVLIVAPVSLLDNWEREFNQFFATHSVPLLKLYGSTLSAAKFKKDQIPATLQAQGIRNLLRPGWIGQAKIVLTTYETLRDQQFSFGRQAWSIMICDEAQKIKNPGALITRAAQAMHVRFRVACTGTPVENSLTDLWCLFEFVQPGLLGSLNEFGANYRRPIESSSDRDVVALDKLRKLIEPQILRRVKADVAKDLPAKIEDGASRALGIERRQRDLYLSELSEFTQRQQMMEKLESRGGGILGLLHTLKLICAHPYSVRPEANLRKNSPKALWLLAQLQRIRDRDEKAIIFTELRDVQRELQQLILENFGLKVTVINGDTNPSSQKGPGRQGLIDQFQQQPGFNVIILSTVAVGFGVNVQAANHVIHFTRCWNPAKEDQATDRAYRIGQTKDVTVYYPTVVDGQFKTFEETLDELLSKKRALAGDMLNGTADISAAEFKEILEAPCS